MKQFFIAMLGTLAGLVVFCFSGAVLFFGLMGIMVAMGGDSAPGLQRGSFIVYDLSTSVVDAPSGFDFGSLKIQGHEIQLRTVTRALHAAAHDDRIAGVFLKGSSLPVDSTTGYAALREIREALGEVRAAGKPIYAYLPNASTKDYYLASVASDVAVDPFGMILMPGLASEPMFFSGALEKYGVGIQVTRVGKYKSFVEPFTRKDMSPENREQIQKLLNDLWTDLIADMAKSRKITPAEIQAVVDAEGIIRPEAAKAGKLVDRTAYIDEVIADLKRRTGGAAGAPETFKQITLGDYARLEGEKTGGGTVAVVYAEGDIVDGEGVRGQVGGAKFARELRKLRQDEKVKAVVLRVNSPGGSAPASEAIQREIRLTREVKPVIVSMGSYAASGGYWIASYGNRIFAEPTTVTGSIGVFGIQFDVQKLANNLGVTFDSVKTGKFGDSVTISRPKTDEEMAVFQRLVDWIYGEFLDKVAESRKLARATVDEIAQGRVWSGLEAQKLGLVDEIGGMDAAIAYAAKEAKLGSDFHLTEFPRNYDIREFLAEYIGAPEGTPVDGAAKKITERIASELKTLSSFNEPSGLYARMPFSLQIR